MLELGRARKGGFQGEGNSPAIFSYKGSSILACYEIIFSRIGIVQ